MKYHKLRRVTLRTGVEIILGENWTIKMNFNWMISYQFYDQGLSYLLLRHQIILFYTRSLVYQVEDCNKIDVTNKIYLVPHKARGQNQFQIELPNNRSNCNKTTVFFPKMEQHSLLPYTSGKVISVSAGRNNYSSF